MSSSLISLQTPFTSSSLEDKRIVKGFVSCERPDRSNDVVLANSFNLKNFANNKQLWLDHQLIKEFDGTLSSAGLITLATASYIKGENPNNSEEWVVNRVETDEFVSFFPKSQVPDLIPTDRGLFVVAEVTHEKAIQKVDSGEVMAFSWQGRAKTVENADGTTTMLEIDLIEMSLVHVGDNNQSNFVIVDPANPEFNQEIAIKSCVPYKLKFSKEDYDEGTVREYTKKLHPNKQISEGEHNYYVHLTDASDVAVECAFNYTNNIVAAPMKMKNIVTKFDPKEDKMSQDPQVASTESRQAVAVKYAMVNVDALKMLVPSLKVLENVDTFQVVKESGVLEATVDVIEIPQETVEAAIEATLANNTVVDTPVDAPVDQVVDTPVETEAAKTEASEEVEVKNDSEVAELKEGLTVLAQAVAQLVESQNQEAASKATALEATKQAAIEAKKQEAAKAAEAHNQAMKTVLSSLVPAQPVREEKVETAKSFQSSNQRLSNEVIGDAALAYYFNKNTDGVKGAF